MKTIAEQLNIKEFPFEIKDKQGNVIYFENSKNYWVKYEYDKKCNRIYFKNSDNYWSKHEYDEQGNEIYFEDSNNYWIKREYDEQGNEIYCEDSEGIIIDNRVKEMTILEIEKALNIKNLKIVK